jgi:predicted RNA-binding Zn ribbon-like protein
MLDPGDYEGNYTADAGVLCLDFVNTLSWRTSDRPHEWLKSYPDLLAWGQLVGLLTATDIRSLEEFAAQHPEETRCVFQRAIHLREALYRIFSAIDASSPPPEEDVKTLNQELAISDRHRDLKWNGGHFSWSFSEEDHNLDRLLWRVASSAAQLLTSEKLGRVGECQGEGCGWLFLDTSKNHSRRWCSMNDCGNREKARKHYRRKHAEQTSA